MTKQQTNFDTLITPKEKMDEAKNFRQKRRERRIGLLHLLLLSSHMTATMDVDSDDDDEIIAERGTKSIYSYFFTTRACILLFFSSSHSTTTKGKAAIFESENNGQHGAE